jgi:1-deoxy-D-xylulose 5-phosphate reductoisomerase
MKWFLVCLIFYVAAAGLSKYWSSEAALSQAIAQQQGSLTPVDPYHCPASQVIKGNFSAYSGERCIFHSPGGRFYEKTKAEKCYASPADAIADGCRPSPR